MAYRYEFQINKVHYPVFGLVDNSASAKWERGSNQLMRKKYLTGTFILNQAGNEQLFDLLVNLSHCSLCFILVYNEYDELIISGAFNRRTIKFILGKCRLEIKPFYYDRTGIDAILKEEYNIINTSIPTHTIQIYAENKFEFMECTANHTVPDLNFYRSFYRRPIPVFKAWCKAGDPFVVMHNHMTEGWSFYSQETRIVSSLPSGVNVSMTTSWFREVKLVPKVVDPDNNRVPPQGTSTFAFEYLETITINGSQYNKYVRNVDNLVGDWMNAPNFVIRNFLTNYYGRGNALREITRARRFIDVLDYYRDRFGCTLLVSEFFTSPVNPISGRDLRNLMLVQKSDGIFASGNEPSDPATLGMITFEQLEHILWAMFQVTWHIEDDVFYVEHINYFIGNHNYNVYANPVGLDITEAYPIALDGNYTFEYDDNLPVREQYRFEEAWNIDFIGSDIEYTNCVRQGGTESYSADLITTDYDPTYVDNEASRDGFFMFHCNEQGSVISEEGKLSGMFIANNHLGWANLHSSYHRSYRWLDTGRMNGEYIGFSYPHRKLKKQADIELPFCIENIDDIKDMQCRTNMGDGTIESIEYSFKTGSMKLKILHDD